MSVIDVEDVQVRAIAEVMLAEADEDARVRLAQSTLASRTGLAPRTLRRALDRMVQAGWVEVEDAGSPNSPATHRVERLRSVAAEAGWNATPARPAGVLRSLSAEEAHSPLGAVSAGERLSVAPDLLVEGENVRSDLRLDEVFVDTVRDLGVLKDIDVYPTLTGLVVLDGHRRLQAALAAGLDAVTVRVVEVGSEQERIATQLVENDAHLHTASLERARAVQQLVLLGMSVKDLRKHGVTRAEVSAAKELAKVPEVKELAEAQPQMDLVTLGSIAELAEGFSDEERDGFDLVVEEIRGAPDQAPFVIEREKRAALLRRRIRAAVEEVQARGVRALAYWELPDTARSLVLLVSDRGDEIDPQEHASSCEGHAVRISLGWNDELIETPVCVDWAERGHRNRYAAPSSGATSGPMSEEKKAERAQIIQKNRDGEAANVIRQGWVRNQLMKRRKLPADWALFAAPVLDWARLRVSEPAMSQGLDILRVSTDLFRSPDVNFHAERGIFHMALAAVEGVFSKSFWRRDGGGRIDEMQRLYLRSLSAWGYTLSSLEKAFCEEVEASVRKRSGWDKTPLHATPKTEEETK